MLGYSNSSKIPSANAGVKNSQRRTIDNNNNNNDNNNNNNNNIVSVKDSQGVNQ